jgi:hypothetical protein
LIKNPKILKGRHSSVWLYKVTKNYNANCYIKTLPKVYHNSHPAVEYLLDVTTQLSDLLKATHFVADLYI